MSLAAVASNAIVIVFSEPVVGADNLTAFEVSGPSGILPIDQLSLSADTQSVTLTTAPQRPEAAYSLTLRGITDRAALPLASPAALDFVGFGAADKQKPTLVTVAASHAAGVLVQFSEPIEPTTTPAGAIEISGLSVLDVLASADRRSLVVATSPQLPGATYSISVQDVVDASGNPLESSPVRTSFVGYGVPDSNPPTLLSPLKEVLIDPPSITLLWTARSGAADYRVEIATDQGFSSIVRSATVPGEQTSLTIPSAAPALAALTEATTYYWRVRANHTQAEFTTGIPIGSTSSYPADYFDVLRQAVLVACPSALPCGPGPEVGNACRPFRSISAGIGAAQVHGLHEVRVQGCTGEVFVEQVDLADGVSLRGGYDATFSVADPVAHKTRVESSSVAVLTASEVTQPTVVDGLELAELTGGGPLSSAYGAYISHSDGLTLSRLTVLPRSTINSSVGVFVGSSALGATLGTGLVIEDCDISADDVEDYGGAQSIALRIEDSSVVLRHNALRGGRVTTSSSSFGQYIASALEITSSKIDADRNFFYGGDLRRGAVTPTGAPSLGNGNHASWTVTAYQSTLRFTNNLLESGTFSSEIGATSGSCGVWGIYSHSPVGSSIYANNTIVLHSLSCTSVRGMYLQGRQDVVNNLIVSEPNTAGTATELTGYSELAFSPAPGPGGYSPASFHGNVVAGFPTCPYRRYNGTYACLTSIGALQTYHGTVGTPSSQNTLMIGASGAAWVGFLGLSSTGGAGDYRLGPSAPTSITVAGIDTSQNGCGLSSNGTCGGMTIDLDDANRTCDMPATACFSVGAYER